METIEQVARAYDIRWLVLDREDSVDADRPDPRRRADGRPGRGEPVLAVGQPAASGRVPGGGGAVTRREAVLSALPDLRRSRWSRAPSSPRRSSSRSPRTPPTTWAWPATCSRAAVSSATRCGASRRHRLIFPRPAFEVWLPLPTFLAAIPMALFGTTFAAAQISSVARRRDRAGPRLAAGRRRRRGARTARGRARTLALGAGLTTRRLPAAAPPLRPARLDDAVRGDRARRAAC